MRSKVRSSSIRTFAFKSRLYITFSTLTMNKDWTSKEVKLIVEDYFDMLLQELSHSTYNKSAHRQQLLPLLEDRNEGSIEFKHRNISAALTNMGLPSIKGYKPLFNYQKELLENEIAKYISKNRPNLELKFEQFADEIIVGKSGLPVNYNSVLDSAPDPTELNEGEPLYKPVKINFLEKEQNNRRLGELGEKFVLEFEKVRLINAGKVNLSDKIEWVSKKIGDGTGYDILSKNVNGTDRFIEVKTTKLSKTTPIYLSKNELRFSEQKGSDFFLYRVFDFAKNPKLFIKQGNYKNFCQLQPQVYKGFF